MIHLHTHTHYSIHDSVVLPHVLIARCVELGMKKIAITDHGSMMGVVETAAIGEQEGVFVIPGIEAYIGRQHVTLLAYNEQGYVNLLKMPPRLKSIEELPTEGIICLSGCSLKGVVPNAKEPEIVAAKLK